MEIRSIVRLRKKMPPAKFYQNDATKRIKKLNENPSKCVTTSNRSLNENQGQFTQHNFPLSPRARSST
jgi:hypothetical protein